MIGARPEGYAFSTAVVAVRGGDHWRRQGRSRSSNRAAGVASNDERCTRAVGQRRHRGSSGMRTLLCWLDHLAGGIAGSPSGSASTGIDVRLPDTKPYVPRSTWIGPCRTCPILGQPTFGIALRPKCGRSPVAARPPRPGGCVTGKHRGLIEPQGLWPASSLYPNSGVNRSTRTGSSCRMTGATTILKPTDIEDLEPDREQLRTWRTLMPALGRA